MSLVSGIFSPGNNGKYKTRREIEMVEFIKNFTAAESNARKRGDTEAEGRGNGHNRSKLTMGAKESAPKHRVMRKRVRTMKMEGRSKT